MKILAIYAVLGFAAPALVQSTDTYTLWYDDLYDQRNASLNSVACSNGDNGLMTRGYHTFGDLPTFPAIGGAPQIESWGSNSCGTCWLLTYATPNGGKRVELFTAINTGSGQGGFTISREGITFLSETDAQSGDGVKITAALQAASECGL